MVRPALMRKQPFLVTRSVNGAHTMHAHVQLQLTDAIDDAYRIQCFTHDIILSTTDAQCQAASSLQRYTFTTQSVMYSPSTSTSRSSLDEPSCQPLVKRQKFS